MSKIFGAEELPCPVCKAEPGAACTYYYGSGRRRERKFRFGAHANRVRDAQVATETLRALTES